VADDGRPVAFCHKSELYESGRRRPVGKRHRKRHGITCTQAFILFVSPSMALSMTFVHDAMCTDGHKTTAYAALA